jgi:competence protein ComEC
MIRGRPSFLLCFSLFLWGGLLALEQRGAAGWVFLGAVCAAGAGIVFLHLPAEWGRIWGRALILAAAGGAVSLALMVPRFPAASAALPYARPDTPYAGLPIRQVEAFAGTLVADSTSSPDGSVSFRLDLRQVWGRAGERAAEASGQALVLSSGALRLYRGQEAFVQGRLALAEAAGAAAFVGRVRSGAVRGGAIGSRLLRRRALWLAAVERGLNRLDPEVSALLAALLLGSRSEVSPAVYEQFRRSGALHLLALSGLHVGIVFALLWGLLLFLPRRNLRRLAAAAGVLGYLFLVGVRPSLLRAVVMLLGAGFAAALDREADPLNLLSLAAALVLLLDPWRYADLGCQLSFLSLAGICVFSPHLSRLLGRWLPRWLCLPVAVSAAAQAGSAPLLLLHFGVVQPVGILAGVVLIPLVSVFLWGGLAALPLVLVGGPVLAAADWLLRGLHSLLFVFLGLFSRVPPLWLAWRPWFWIPFAALLLGAAVGLPARSRLRVGASQALGRDS